jgi:phage minor structural protein
MQLDWMQMEIPLWGDIVIIFEQDEQNFDTIGLGMLVPNSGEVYEEFNGDFTLTFQHPYDASGKWKRIEIDRIVLAETPRGRQPFRIYYYKPTMNGIEVQARHLFYDLLDNICESVAYSGSAQGAMDAIKEGLSVPMPFTFYTDISCDTGGIGCTMDNPVSLLLKEEWDNNEGETKSFFYFYGGELKRDFFNVSMLESLGSDRGVFIVYRKNLVGLEVTEDISDVATRIYPIGKDGLALDGQYIDSQYVNNYAYPKVKVIEDTKAESQSDLREIAENFFAEGGDIPKVNIKVDFIDLSQTEEYKNYANLEKVFLGDTVTVVNQKMGFSKKAKIISYEFDVILGRYNKIELGDFSPTVTSPITRGANAGDIANTAYGKSNNAETLLQQHLKDFNNPHRVTAEQVGSGGTGGGSTVLNGTEAPSDALGNDGDYYIKDEVQGIADEHTLLLLHGEDFTDSSIYSEQITNTGCTLSDSGKFGKAISFTNLNKLETVEQIFDINGEFTIDFWFSQREKKANATFIGGTQTGTFKIILSNGIPVFQVHGQTSYYSSFVDTQLNTWYHFALTGKNKTYSMFVDGVKKNTFTYTGNISNDILRIGLNVAQNSTGSIEGVMDEIRISNVVRWDSDFTPPTEPYTVYKNAQAGEIYVKESGTWKKILTGMK